MKTPGQVLYERQWYPVPTWDQLGEMTRGVWESRALFEPVPPDDDCADLF